MNDIERAVAEFLKFCETADSTAVDEIKLDKGLPSREALREFLKEHIANFHPTASEMRDTGNTMVFLYYDQEAWGDRTYYYCKEDGEVYSDYFSIGD